MYVLNIKFRMHSINFDKHYKYFHQSIFSISVCDLHLFTSAFSNAFEFSGLKSYNTQSYSSSDSVTTRTKWFVEVQDGLFIVDRYDLNA